MCSKEIVVLIETNYQNYLIIVVPSSLKVHSKFTQSSLKVFSNRTLKVHSKLIYSSLTAQFAQYYQVVLIIFDLKECSTNRIINAN